MSDDHHYCCNSTDILRSKKPSVGFASKGRLHDWHHDILPCAFNAMMQRDKISSFGSKIRSWRKRRISKSLHRRSQRNHPIIETPSGTEVITSTKSQNWASSHRCNTHDSRVIWLIAVSLTYPKATNKSIDDSDGISKVEVMKSDLYQWRYQFSSIASMKSVFDAHISWNQNCTRKLYGSPAQ